MKYDHQKVQWTLTVTIYHAPNFWHYVELATETAARGSTDDALGSWQGMGCPEIVLNGITAQVTAAIEDHILARYGVQDPLALRWDTGGDPA